MMAEIPSLIFRLVPFPESKLFVNSFFCVAIEGVDYAVESLTLYRFLSIGTDSITWHFWLPHDMSEGPAPLGVKYVGLHEMFTAHRQLSDVNHIDMEIDYPTFVRFGDKWVNAVFDKKNWDMHLRKISSENFSVGNSLVPESEDDDDAD